MKTLIMLSAIPAAGKSTWAKQYRDTHEEVYIVSSDEIRMELTGGDYHDRSKQALVWETFEPPAPFVLEQEDDLGGTHPGGARAGRTDALFPLRGAGSRRTAILAKHPHRDRKRRTVALRGQNVLSPGPPRRFGQPLPALQGPADPAGKRSRSSGKTAGR